MRDAEISWNFLLSLSSDAGMTAIVASDKFCVASASTIVSGSR
jgi:hypothetical protein